MVVQVCGGVVWGRWWWCQGVVGVGVVWGCGEGEGEGGGRVEGGRWGRGRCGGEGGRGRVEGEKGVGV